jgi:hypothetical protein
MNLKQNVRSLFHDCLQPNECDLRHILETATYRSVSLWRLRLLEDAASKDCDEEFMVVVLLLMMVIR